MPRRLKARRSGSDGSQSASPVPEDVLRALEKKREFFWCAFKALAFNKIGGDYTEFGCFGGKTFALAYEQIARRPKTTRHMWAFDSFAGLPDTHDPADVHPRWLPGRFAMDVEAFDSACESKGIPRSAYTAVAGFFEQSLGTAEDSDPPTNIALAYVDCDMYSSTRTVLDYLRPRLKHGMILAFDDFFCFSAEYPSGEKLAFEELVASEPEWRFERYRDFGWAGASFVVERREDHTT